MEKKLPEDQVKSVLAPWRFSWQSSGFKDRLLTALELYEHFPLAIAVTGGTKSVNARLASAVCGLTNTQEEENEAETDEDEAGEDEDEEDSDSDGPDSALVLHHSRIPSVRVLTLHGGCNAALERYDVLVVLTTELHQDDHVRLTMEQSERNKPLYLVKAEQEMDIVREKLAGPCKTCAWERMQARALEFQKKQKAELESAEKAKRQAPLCIKLWELKEIAEVLLKDIPELRKKAFSTFLVDLTSEHRGLGSIGTGSKMDQEDLCRISLLFQSQDLTDQPSKLLSIFSALEYFRLDVGLLGETGCGSSSLFNSLLGLKNLDQGSSPTGVFETTKAPVTYPYSEYRNVLLWDLPGLGRIEEFKTRSSGFTLKQDFPILPCDIYILVSPLRLNLGYIQLLKHLMSQGKDCYLVLSKADMIEETFIEDVRRWNKGILDKLGLRQMVYMVSSVHPETLDFPKLRKAFNDALERHKRVALANYVVKLVEEDVFWKRADPCKIN